MSNDECLKNDEARMTNVARSMPAALLVGSLAAYMIAYAGFRWQKVLIRTASCYSMRDALYENSQVRAGWWHGGSSFQRFKKAAGAPAEFVFRPLCAPPAQFP